MAKVIAIIKEQGPHLGLFIKDPKCELFSKCNLNSFPVQMKRSNTPNLVLLGAPIGDLIFCAKFIANLRSKIRGLLSRLQQIGPKDPQVAYLLLRSCGSFCKLVHLARSTPPSLVAEALSLFDSDIRRCFTECTSVDVPDVAWHQAQLSPSRGGLGLRSLYHRSNACFIASISQSGITLGGRANHHLEQSINDLNHIIGESEAVSVQDILEAPPRQRILSSKIKDQQLRMLFDLASSPAQRARLLSVSSPHASAWLSVMPTPQLNLHLEPPEFQVALKWWLGMDTSQNARCSLCPSHALDPLGHHAQQKVLGQDLVARQDLEF